MSEAIVVESISKTYAIGGVKETGYRTLRDSLVSVFKPRAGSQKRTVQALRDVSFTAQKGEVIGIVGRNGAGKSTLLKILSRITEPTSGHARLHGRLGSLLEVGTGFHPELTGRENIFLNGAILGMRRQEIQAKLDEIVAFAEVERFLETPVKRYSSGMYVRLAFAVAAHLNDDILIVDEVLAVGDARFQRKCLEKMEDVGRHGRTILFVSHNLASITRLCSRAILLEGGRLVADGAAHDVVRQYLKTDIGATAEKRWTGTGCPTNGVVRLERIRLTNSDGEPSVRLDIRRPLTIAVDWENMVEDRAFVTTLQFMNMEGVIVFVTQDLDPAWRNRKRPRGHYRSEVVIPGNFLAEGTFLVNVSISTIETGEDHVIEREALVFDVIDNFSGESARGDYGGDIPGVVRPLFSWKNTVL